MNIDLQQAYPLLRQEYGYTVNIPGPEATSMYTFIIL